MQIKHYIRQKEREKIESHFMKILFNSHIIKIQVVSPSAGSEQVVSSQ